MQENRFTDRLRPSVMKKRCTGAQAPERGCPHLVRTGLGLNYSVAKRSHMMQKQVRGERHILEVQGGTYVAGAGLHGGFVTGYTVNLGEQPLTPQGLLAKRQRRWRSYQFHEIS